MVLAIGGGNSKSCMALMGSLQIPKSQRKSSILTLDTYKRKLSRRTKFVFAQTFALEALGYLVLN